MRLTSGPNCPPYRNIGFDDFPQLVVYLNLLSVHIEVYLFQKNMFEFEFTSILTSYFTCHL